MTKLFVRLSVNRRWFFTPLAFCSIAAFKLGVIDCDAAASLIIRSLDIRVDGSAGVR